MDVSHHPKPSRIIRPANYSAKQLNREEGVTTYRRRSSMPINVGGDTHITPSRPNAQKVANAITPIMRNANPDRIKSLDEIAKLAGQRPEKWTKPKFGDFDYWLARNCDWISDAELRADTAAYEAKKHLALQTSHRFSTERYSWDEQPRYEEPVDNGEYAPEINMKLVKDRNLTDSARRIALFIMRHTYQDNREGRFIGMTVSFIMKGLELSRRTVQRSLTLLETRGYFRCEVAHNEETRMCVGLIICLLKPLFPHHYQKNWPQRCRNSAASDVPHKQPRFRFQQQIYQAKRKVLRISWALRCMDGVYRAFSKTQPMLTTSHVSESQGFQATGGGGLAQSDLAC